MISSHQARRSFVVLKRAEENLNFNGRKVKATRSTFLAQRQVEPKSRAVRDGVVGMSRSTVGRTGKCCVDPKLGSGLEMVFGFHVGVSLLSIACC
jgi:hypothetical protein